ncbi:hypothetical protein HGRIS_009129 [Hohenbuehelia grisea]|uniref:Uncharacterized protein n=1 Tax=Hohenbuehelia grisea TaxID=104357 RepID=A0ABR3J0M6_9AGAR
MVTLVVNSLSEFLPQKPIETCSVLYEAASWLIVICISVAEAIMMIRVWAIWGRPLWLAALLAFTFITLSVISVVTGLKFTTSHAFIVNPKSAGMPGCLAIHGDKIGSAGFIGLMVGQALTFSLTMAKGLQTSSSFSTLAKTIVTDGIVYFAILLTVTLVNVILFLVAPRESADLHSVQQMVLHSILSGRILMHLREQGARDTVADETSMQVFTTNCDSMVFAQDASHRWRTYTVMSE